jgi:tetratricopeptide (TPR) repeat protein
MKILFTLFLFLLTGLTLSAAVSQKDTMKLTASVGLDSQKTVEQSLHKSNLTSPLFVKYSGSLDLATLTRAADSIRLEDSVSEFNHLKILAGIRSTDSANYMLLVRQIDTTKTPAYAHALDSLKQLIKPMGTDTVKQQLKLPQNKLFKGPIYTEIASRYMDYDTLSNKHIRSNFQTQALNYTIQALHQYSLYNDTTGMRICFDGLSKIYIAQKKYSQAKWFTLQSNTLSRVKNDVPNIIASLITLSTIKSEIKDYDLAMRDLNEALQLSQTNHYQKTEADVLRYYAMFYSRQKKYTKEALVLKKRDSLVASIQKAQDAKMLAKVAAHDSIQRKKADSLLSKKKVYTSNIKKLSKNGPTRKIASL